MLPERLGGMKRRVQELGARLGVHIQVDRGGQWLRVYNPTEPQLMEVQAWVNSIWDPLFSYFSSFSMLCGHVYN